MQWLNSLYGFLNLLGGGYQSLLRSITGDYEVIYTTVQFILINKILSLVFVRKMKSLQNLKQVYLYLSIALGAMLLFAPKNSVIMLLALDLLIVTVSRINTQNLISNTHKLWMTKSMSKYNGMARIASGVFGISASLAVKFEMATQMLWVLAALHGIMTIYTYTNWKIKWVPERLFKKKKKPLDKQLVVFIASSVIISTGSVFNLYYLKLSEANGYSLSLLALLGSLTSFIVGGILLVRANSEKHLDNYGKKLFVTRLILGATPLMVIFNFPMYPYLRLAASIMNSYAYTKFQTMFLSAKDKGNLAFLTGIQSVCSYGAYTLGIMAIKAEIFPMEAVAVYSLIAYAVGGYMGLQLKEDGMEHDYTLTI